VWRRGQGSGGWKEDRPKYLPRINEVGEKAFTKTSQLRYLEKKKGEGPLGGGRRNLCERKRGVFPMVIGGKKGERPHRRTARMSRLVERGRGNAHVKGRKK